MISNFSRNIPQTKLDLGDYRFICFVKTGLFPPFFEKGHNHFFFLVSPPKENNLRLMMYRTFAWPVDP